MKFVFKIKKTHKTLILFGICLLLYIVPLLGYAVTFDSAWPYRVKITVQNGKVDADLSDFPVYVNLNNLDAQFHTHVKSDACDIRVTTSDGVTQVPIDLVFYTAASDTGELHFKASSLANSSDTIFYLYYGNASASCPAENATYGAQNTWRSEYKAVYHMQALNDTDSTANNNDGTAAAGHTSGDVVAGGQLAGNYHNFDDLTTDYIDIGTGSSLDITTDITLSAWVNTSDTSTNNLITGYQDAGSYPGYGLVIGTPTASKAGYYQGTAFSGGNTAVTGAWTFIQAAADATSLIMYRNGASDGTTVGDKRPSLWDGVRTISNTSSGYSYNGDVDEIRIYNGKLTGTWLSTEYNNQNSPSTFYVLGAEEANPASWYNSSWLYRIALQTDPVKVTADLTNFPVYVNLNDLESNFHTNVNQTDARDIRVTAADGITEVPREVVFYTAASDTGELHFKASSLSNTATTTFYIYYGNTAATEPATSDTYGRNAVWTDYELVYHLQADPSGSAPQATDSSGTGNDGTANTMLTGALVDGKLSGKAYDFDGSSDYVSKTDNASLDVGTGAFTLQAWANPSNANHDQIIVAKREGSGSFKQYNMIAGHIDSGGNFISSKKFGFLFVNDFNSNSLARNSTADVWDGNWHKLDITRSGSTVVAYNNGAAETMTTTVSNGSAGASDLDNTATFELARGNFSTFFPDTIDEVRLRKEALTSTWISTEYNNQNSPSTFYADGSQESNGVAATPRYIRLKGVRLRGMRLN